MQEGLYIVRFVSGSFFSRIFVFNNLARFVFRFVSGSFLGPILYFQQLR